MKRMRRCFPVLLAVFLLLCTGAYAEAPPISTAPAQADVDWKGTVWPEVDLTILVTVAPQDSAGAAAADAGAPIPGAVVTAACLPPGGGRTGNDGRLTITGLAANTGQDFAVSAAGYQAGGAQGVLPGQYTGRELVISLVRLAAAPPTAQPSAAPEPGGADAAATPATAAPLRTAGPAATPPSRPPGGADTEPTPTAPGTEPLPTGTPAPQPPQQEDRPAGPAGRLGEPTLADALLLLLLLLFLLFTALLLCRGRWLIVEDETGKRLPQAAVTGPELKRAQARRGKFCLGFAQPTGAQASEQSGYAVLVSCPGYETQRAEFRRRGWRQVEKIVLRQLTERDSGAEI